MATFHSPLIVGVFRDEAAAQSAVSALNNAGFSKDQIGVALREGGMVTPTLLQDLMKLGVPQDQASYYDKEYRAGHAVVSVRPEGREQVVRDILMRHGAYDYATRAGVSGQAARADVSGQAAKTETVGPSEAEEKRSIKLRGEQLQVEKQTVETGEVRLSKEVVSEERQFDVPVTREEVTVEQHRYREPRVSETPVGQEETIRVPIREEQVQVTKIPVETGEVTISKQVVEEEEHITETVKHEEPRLGRKGDTSSVYRKEDMEQS